MVRENKIVVTQFKDYKSILNYNYFLNMKIPFRKKIFKYEDKHLNNANTAKVSIEISFLRHFVLFTICLFPI